MKYGLLADLHFGEHKNDLNFYNFQYQTFKKACRIFKERGVETIIILGDTVHHRDISNNIILSKFKVDVLDYLNDTFDSTLILIGNHDMSYKHTRKETILEAMIKDRYENIEIINEITEYNNMLLVPWIINEKELAQVYNNTGADICLGHFEINGFRYAPNTPIVDGKIPRKVFKNFDLTISGHFHTKQDMDNIHYLGTMTPLSWSEYGTDHGIHILEDDILDFIPLNDSMYRVVEFENRSYTNTELESYKGKIVKIILNEKYDVKKYKSFDDKLKSLAKKTTMIKKQLLINNDTDEDTVVIDEETDLLDEYLTLTLPKHLDKEKFKLVYGKIKDRICQ